MTAIVPVLECLLTILVVALCMAAVFWVLRLAVKAVGNGAEIPPNVMLLLGAIAAVILLIIAVQCFVGGGTHVHFFQ